MSFAAARGPGLGSPVITVDVEIRSRPGTKYRPPISKPSTHSGALPRCAGAMDCIKTQPARLVGLERLKPSPPDAAFARFRRADVCADETKCGTHCVGRALVVHGKTAPHVLQGSSSARRVSAMRMGRSEIKCVRNGASVKESDRRAPRQRSMASRMVGMPLSPGPTRQPAKGLHRPKIHFKHADQPCCVLSARTSLNGENSAAPVNPVPARRHGWT